MHDDDHTDRLASMPKINCQTFNVGDGASGAIESAVSEATRGFGDAPGIGRIDDAIALLRSRSAANGCLTMHFRVNDFPFLTVVWQQFGTTAAIAHVLRDGLAEGVHLLLNERDAGDKANVIESLRRRLGKSFPCDFNGDCRNGEDVAHHTFILRPIEAEDDFSDVLAFIALVPIFCEYCGID